MNGLVQNIRYAIRQLRKRLGFTAVAIITLALGIAATTAIYSVLYAALLAPLPYPSGDQLVMVWSRDDGQRNIVSAGDYLDWKHENDVFSDLNAATSTGFDLAQGDRPQRIPGSLVTPGWYAGMGVGFALGRDFLPEEGVPGGGHEVILTHRLWEELGADRNIIGHQLRMNGTLYTVVGVLAAGPMDRARPQLAVPLGFGPQQINHDFHWLLVMGRLKPGVSIAKAQAAMNVIADRIARDHPQSNQNWGVSVEPLKDDFFDSNAQTTLWLLLAAVGFVLLIACVNLANLLLARSATRQRELAVRVSLGATRKRLVSQFLMESVLLAFLGGGLGIALSVAMLKGIMALLPPFALPSEADVRLSWPVLLFTLAVTAFSGILFGSIPAWKTSGVDPHEALKEGGQGLQGRRRHGLGRTLVVSEFALALALLAAAGLSIHNLWNLTQVDLGFSREHLLVFDMAEHSPQFIRPDQMVTYYRGILAKIGTVPGVIHVAAGTGMPLEGAGFGRTFAIAGEQAGNPSSWPSASLGMVTPDYFKTLGIPVLQGREFNDRDLTGNPRVAIVNQAFIEHYLPGVDPLSQRILLPETIPGVTNLGPPVDWQIVGVVRNFHSGGIRSTDHPVISVPFWQSPWPSAVVAVRTKGDPASMTKSIAAAVNSIHPGLPLANVRTMDQVVSDSMADDRFATVVFGSFAGLALLLAAVGIYGVMAFLVAQRTHEIGIRMALGAARTQVIRMILREGIALAFVGLGIGLIGAMFVGRVMQSMLYHVRAMDFTSLIAVGIALLMAAAFACYIPARRAAKVDPMEALRYE